MGSASRHLTRYQFVPICIDKQMQPPLSLDTHPRPRGRMHAAQYYIYLLAQKSGAHQRFVTIPLPDGAGSATNPRPHRLPKAK